MKKILIKIANFFGFKKHEDKPSIHKFKSNPVNWEEIDKMDIFKNKTQSPYSQMSNGVYTEVLNSKKEQSDSNDIQNLSSRNYNVYRDVRGRFKSKK